MYIFILSFRHTNNVTTCCCGDERRNRLHRDRRDAGGDGSDVGHDDATFASVHPRQSGSPIDKCTCQHAGWTCHGSTNNRLTLNNKQFCQNNIMSRRSQVFFWYRIANQAHFPGLLSWNCHFTFSNFYPSISVDVKILIKSQSFIFYRFQG